MSDVSVADLDAFRAFNRFQTRLTGALNERLLRSEFSLAESRVLFELSEREAPTAARLAEDLSLDRAYLSRILRRLRSAGLVEAAPAEDRRARALALTEAGRARMAELADASRAEAAAALAPLTPEDRARALRAMGEVRRIFGDAPPAGPVVLRDARPGDIGWIVHRQAALYAREHGFDISFDALLAKIGGEFLENRDPARERVWIADRDGETLGAVFVVRASDEVAKLRMLYVEPSARGLGIGRALVRECLSFARAAGYRRMTLWTNDILHAARRIYETEGFALTETAPHRSFGQSLIGETWAREL